MKQVGRLWMDFHETSRVSLGGFSWNKSGVTGWIFMKHVRCHWMDFH